MNLHVTLIQSIQHWEDKAANLAMFEEKLANIEKTDIVVLPEMFTTGFSMNTVELGESMTGKTMQWLATHAKRLDAAIVATCIIEEGQKYYNRLIFMKPDGTFEQYDKRHLFMGERASYEAGNERIIVDWRGWKICPLTCYDLRFPVWSRNTADFDLLLYTANWPQARIDAWDKLLMARAIENQCYVVAVNRVGSDEKGRNYIGHTSIINAMGHPLQKLEKEEGTVAGTLLRSHRDKVRKHLPFLEDRGDFLFN